jgi:uncharacterized protein (DUF1330 family)
MTVERLVGLFVTDDGMYQKYREAMLPVLQTYGGGFRYDFKISDVLKSETQEPINRVFAIYFENEHSMNQFFADEKYVEIRNKYYEPSVSAATVISKYER